MKIIEFAREQVQNGSFSINRICKLCGISKKTFISWNDLDEKFIQKYKNIKNIIEKIILDNNSYGVKRIKACLLDQYNVHIGRDALGRLLKLWGLHIRRNIKKKKKSLIKKILIALSDKVNLLIRTKIKDPFKAITSDITKIYFNNGKNKAYLAIHKDVFGQKVYGWCLKTTMEADLVINSFKKARKNIKKLTKSNLKNIICHQDQGSQYTGYEYVDCVLKNKYVLSYSTPGTPTENPGQESFFGRFKDECRDEINEIKTFRGLEKFIHKRIDYYNNKRIHTSINYQTPAQFTNNFIKNNSLFLKKKWFHFSRT